MGVSITCRKTGRTIDMGAGGFLRLRRKVSELQGGRSTMSMRRSAAGILAAPLKRLMSSMPASTPASRNCSLMRTRPSGLISR